MIIEEFEYIPYQRKNWSEHAEQMTQHKVDEHIVLNESPI